MYLFKVTLLRLSVPRFARWCIGKKRKRKKDKKEKEKSYYEVNKNINALEIK